MKVCPIHKEGKDVSRHLFLHCDIVYKVWASVASLWGVNFVGARDVASIFEV